MAQKLLAQGIEDATLTLTNTTSSSDGRQLKNRDARVNSIDEASGSSTIQIEVDYAVSTTVDYILLGNLNTDADITISFYRWNGASYDLVASESADTYTNANHFFTFSSATATQFRIDLNPSTSAAIELSYIIMGVDYDLPVSYQVPANLDSYIKGRVELDAHGYPYGENINTARKKIWEIEYRLTDTQLDTLRTNLAYAWYNQRPFVWYDTEVDTTYRLVRLDQEDVPGEHIAINYKRVPLRLVEL